MANTAFHDALYSLFEAGDKLQSILHPAGERPIDVRSVLTALRRKHSNAPGFRLALQVLASFIPASTRLTDVVQHYSEDLRLDRALQQFVNAVEASLLTINRKGDDYRGVVDVFVVQPGSLNEAVLLAIFPEAAVL